jgi:hypothetical protein
MCYIVCHIILFTLLYLPRMLYSMSVPPKTRPGHIGFGIGVQLFCSHCIIELHAYPCRSQNNRSALIVSNGGNRSTQIVQLATSRCAACMDKNCSENAVKHPRNLYQKDPSDCPWPKGTSGRWQTPSEPSQCSDGSQLARTLDYEY